MVSTSAKFPLLLECDARSGRGALERCSEDERPADRGSPFVLPSGRQLKADISAATSANTLTIGNIRMPPRARIMGQSECVLLARFKSVRCRTG